PILLGPVNSLSLLFGPIPLRRTVCSILPWCLTGCAVLLRCTIQWLLARRLAGRTVLFIPFRPQRLLGLAALLFQIASARLVLSILWGSLPSRLGAAAVLRCLAATWRLVVDPGRILWRYSLCWCAAFLLRYAFLLSHRSTRCSHKRDDCARYQQVGSIHLV